MLEVNTNIVRSPLSPFAPRKKLGFLDILASFAERTATLASHIRFVAMVLMSFLRSDCLCDAVHAQSAKTTATSPVVQTTPTIVQVARQPLRSRFGTTDSEEVITLGNQTPGDRIGLEGVVYRYTDVKTANQNGGYIRWYVLLRRMDGMPFARDEQLQLEFIAMSTGFEPEVLHNIELTQGALESTSSFLVPEYPDDASYRWQNRVIRFYRNGRELRGLKASQRGNNNNNNVASQRNNGVSKLPTVMIGTSASLSSIASSAALVELQSLESKEGWCLPHESLALLSRLPTDWRELAVYPSLAIGADELSTCNPQQTKALRQYVATGGKLIIADCPIKPDLREDIAAWIKAFSPASLSNSKHVNSNRESQPSSLLFSIGFGELIVHQGKQNDAYGPQSLFAVSSRDSRLDRLFGVELMEWTIPKLGQPPVIAFCFSIGAFAVLAGPVLLWWTNVKTRRPIWFLLFFPLFAFVITSSIFAYAIIHDGLGITGRIRSITWVDAQSGFGSAYSRQTYFSGFPPSSVEFKNTSEFWEVPSPHDERGPDYSNDPHSDVRLQVIGDRQIYQGLLTAREQKQWIVTTPVEDLKPFEWLEPSDEGDKRIRNRLSETWKMGLFVDKDRKIYVVDGLATGKAIEAKSISLDDARILLNKAVPKLLYPPGYSDVGSQSLFGWFNNSRSYYNRYQSNANGNVKSLQSSFESTLDKWSIDSIVKPNQFILIIDRADHLDRPFETNVYETDSSHFVMGTW